MEVPAEQSTVNCSYCNKPVPAANIDLHSAHCFRISKRNIGSRERSPNTENARRNTNETEKHQDAHRIQWSCGSLHKGLLSMIAVVVVAVALGSMFYKREVSQ